jgi:hypothetical protein
MGVQTRVLGPEHPVTLMAMGNLAVSLQAMGDLPGACQLEEKAVGARTRVLGPEHPDTILARRNLSALNREVARPQWRQLCCGCSICSFSS